MKRTISVMCAALLVPALALAQAKTADEYYKEGETAYNLGNFAAAVEAFKKGYEAEPDEARKAAYLYNIGQAYRQAKDCGNAQFFYKRYLALKDTDQKKPLRADRRAQIEDIIKELEQCAKQQEAIRNAPPDQNERPGEESKGDDSSTEGGPTAPCIARRVAMCAPCAAHAGCIGFVGVPSARYANRPPAKEPAIPSALVVTAGSTRPSRLTDATAPKIPQIAVGWKPRAWNAPDAAIPTRQTTSLPATIAASASRPLAPSRSAAAKDAGAITVETWLTESEWVSS